MAASDGLCPELWFDMRQTTFHGTKQIFIALLPDGGQTGPNNGCAGRNRAAADNRYADFLGS